MVAIGHLGPELQPVSFCRVKRVMGSRHVAHVRRVLDFLVPRLFQWIKSAQLSCFNSLKNSLTRTISKALHQHNTQA